MSAHVSFSSKSPVSDARPDQSPDRRESQGQMRCLSGHEALTSLAPQQQFLAVPKADPNKDPFEKADHDGHPSRRKLNDRQLVVEKKPKQYFLIGERIRTSKAGQRKHSW